jgi:hypothetical protein
MLVTKMTILNFTSQSSSKITFVMYVTKIRLIALYQPKNTFIIVWRLI